MKAEFAGYADVSLVGQGGLGRVYRATRISTGGVVAIKELPDVASASSAWHRARRELEALLRLKGHAGVVSVEEIFEGPHGPCIVMEFMPGGSLHDRLKTGPLSVPEAVLVGQQVSQALRAAHEVGIVHRDVKPHNLMLSRFGQVKVCDFGISALTRGEGDMTQTHAMTLAYASPEELDGSETVGPPADVYSFAATMQHLMTGRKPTFHDRLGGEVPSQFRVGGPVIGPIAEALAAGLNRHPSVRPTMAQMVTVFEAASSALGTSRLNSLPIGAPATDLTVKRRSTDLPAPTPVPRQAPSQAGLSSLSPPRSKSPAPLPSLAGFGVERTATDHTVIAGASAASVPIPPQHYQEPVRSPRRWDRYLLASIALVAVIAAALIVVRDQHRATPAASVATTSLGTTDSTGASIDQTSPAAAPVTVFVTPPLPVASATPSAPSALVASAGPTTQAVATTQAVQPTVIVTVPVQVTVFVVPPTVFIPPTTVPLVTTPPTEALISPAAARATLSSFFTDITTNADIAAAWQLASPQLQAKFKSFERFQCIWSQFSGAQITRTDSTSTSSTQTTLVSDVTFTLASGQSKERITVDIVDVGAGPQLNTYASKALVSGAQIQPCA